MSLSERQEKVKALSSALLKLGVDTLNLLPLDEGKKTLDIRIMDADKEKVLAQLGEWGWETIYKAALPKVTYNGMIPASIYAIDIPFERQEILGDTSRIRGEIAERREKTPMEVEQIRKYLGIPK